MNAQANALDELRGIINYMNQSGVTLPPAMAAACAAAASLPTLQQQATRIASGSSECSSTNDSETIHSTSACSPTIDVGTLNNNTLVDGNKAKCESPTSARSLSNDSFKAINRKSINVDKRKLSSNVSSGDLTTKKIKIDPDQNNRLSTESFATFANKSHV